MATPPGSNALRRLLQRRPTELDAASRKAIADALPLAVLRRLGDSAVPNLDGFAVWHVAPSDDDADGDTFDEILRLALGSGAGLVLRSDGEEVIQLSFGDLATFQMFGAWQSPPGWNGESLPAGTETIREEEIVLVGAPNDDYLPTFIRHAIRAHLQAHGVHQPSVLLVMWSQRGDHRDLAFNIERGRCVDDDGYTSLMQSLAWFMPQGYQWIGWDAVPGLKSKAVRL